MTLDDAQGLQPYGWTPDGDTLVFEYDVGTGRDIGVLSMAGERTWEPLIATAANEEAPAISPMGSGSPIPRMRPASGWSTWSGSRSGAARRPSPAVSSAHPMWSPDGRELFYLTDGGDRLMAVPVKPGPNLQVGEAISLFEGQYFSNPNVPKL